MTKLEKLERIEKLSYDYDYLDYKITEYEAFDELPEYSKQLLEEYREELKEIEEEIKILRMNDFEAKAYEKGK